MAFSVAQTYGTERKVKTIHIVKLIMQSIADKTINLKCMVGIVIRIFVMYNWKNILLMRCIVKKK